MIDADALPAFVRYIKVKRKGNLNFNFLGHTSTCVGDTRTFTHRNRFNTQYIIFFHKYVPSLVSGAFLSFSDHLEIWSSSLRHRSLFSGKEYEGELHMIKKRVEIGFDIYLIYRERNGLKTSRGKILIGENPRWILRSKLL